MRLALRHGPLLVAAGAALGGPARHLVDTVAADGVDTAGDTAAAVGATLAVNVVGALLLGVLATWAGHHRRLLLVLGTGFLGAFTTFGTVMLQVARMSTSGQPVAAAGYVGASVVLGVLAAWAGTLLGRRLPRAGTSEPDPQDPR